MSDVGRFGVFLPSYIWEGDGAERARGIKAFARQVEELGFDSLFITDHLLAARRFYSVNWLEPLIDARGRRRGDGAGAARDVDPDHAAAQPGDPRQGARDAPVPVRQPGDPRRGRRLERRRVRGGRRPQVGARQAHRRDAGHHDAAARGRAGHVPRPVLRRRRRVHRAPDVAAAAAVDRRRLAARGPQVAGRAEVRRLGQGPHGQGGRLDPPPHLPAAGHRPRLAGAPGRDARGGPRPVGLPRRARELPPPRDDRRPGEGPRGAARGVPQGDGERARARPTSSRSTCSGRRTRSSRRSRRGSTPASSTSSSTR